MEYSDRMYDMAYRLYEAAPWEHVGDLCLYAFRSPSSGEMVFCNFMGQGGDYLALGAYIGMAGLQSFYTISVINAEEYVNEDPDAIITDPELSYAIRGQECVQCAFFSEDEALDEQMDSLRTYARGHGRKLSGVRDLAMFQDMRNLHMPMTLTDPVRLKIMEEALETALLHDSYYHNLYGMLPGLVAWGENRIPLYRCDKGKWEADTLDVPPYDEDYGMEFLPFTNKVLEMRLKKLRRMGTLDIELIPFFITMVEDGEEVFPETLLVFHEEADMFLKPLVETHLSGQTVKEVWGSLLDQFIQGILREMEEIPRVIFYRGRRTYCMLRDFCQALKIPLKEREYMPRMDDFMMKGTDMDLPKEYMAERVREMAQVMLKTLKEMDPEKMKEIPPQLKEIIRHPPKEYLDEEVCKALREYAKYL